MQKPNEDIRLLNVFIRDLQEYVKYIEKGVNERIRDMQKEINELKRQVENAQK